jgi:hypothetical protein
MDIIWHHSPVLRLPTRGASIVGRGGWQAHSLLFNPDFTVRRREIACYTTNWEPGAQQSAAGAAGPPMLSPDEFLRAAPHP